MQYFYSRRFLLINIFIISCCVHLFGQTKYERIEVFIKTWGFLKYYHAAIASGKVDWDSVFINHIKKISNSKLTAEFNDQLTNIINGAGEVKKIKPKTLPDDLFTANNKNITGWIDQSKILRRQLKDKLKSIYKNKNQDSNRYIKILYNTADFSVEKKYENIEFPDEAFRLLFLARCWNIINYFAPYKYLAGDWDDVLRKFIPRIINSTDTISYYKTLLELCKSVKDGHSELIVSGQPGVDFVFGRYIVPFYSEIIHGKVIVREVENDSISRVSNIQQGDIILKIDNKSVDEIIKNQRKYISSSNRANENRVLGWYLFDGETTSVKLTIKRENNIFNTTVTRVAGSKRNWGKTVNSTGNDIGYKKFRDSILLIYAAQIWDGNIDTIKYMISQSKAVIFDVRNYPGNDAFFYIADPFLSEPKIIDYSTIAMPDFPGLFKWQPSHKIGNINTSPYKGKVIILADERTQSQGEYSCMVLQTIPGAITIGSQTAGADGVKTYIPMGGTLRMSYSGYGIYYPDKRQTQQTGIKIDIPVKKTGESVIRNQDLILEEALRYLKSKRID